MFIPELSLIKLLLNKYTYNKYIKVVDIKSIKNTYPELGYLYETLNKLHTSTEGDFSLSDLQLFFYKVYPDVDKTPYNALFDRLYEDNTNAAVVEQVLEEMLLRKRTMELSELAFAVASGKGDASKIDEWYSFKEKKALSSLRRVSDSLGELLDAAYKEQGLRWRLQALNTSLGSLREGDFGFIFARPETGKTTFLASEIAFFLTQAQRPILWFNFRPV